jgi:hypothetical protein
MTSSFEKVCILSKEPRKKQFERLVTILYARESSAADSVGVRASGDQPIGERWLKKLIQRMAGDNSSIDVTVNDDPVNLDGLGALERLLGKYGVIVEEVPYTAE